MSGFRKLLSDERGVALVFTIAVFLFLFVLILSVYSTGENIRRKEELQNACDAAAYSAAVVQADALSRMAVINRAMAWTHIQTAKMQMDYITYKWLRRVRDCFREDMDNIAHTGYGDFGSSKMGYYHFSEKFRGKNYKGRWINFSFECKHGIHDKESDARARYIGLGPNTEGYVGGIRAVDNHWIRINGFDATKRHLQYFGGDLFYREGSRAVGPLVLGMESAYGVNAVKLENAIKAGKDTIRQCGEMLKTVNGKMAEAIPVAAKAALYANLPRKPDGSVDSSILRDYVFAISPGALPTSKCDPYDNSIREPSYFDPLYNCEEDEMRFLAMANGIPSNSDNVKLKDFFASSGQGGSLAAGLDQWFIRCDPDESAKDALSVTPRHFAKGIVRAYKNANYEEGKTERGVLRGNYTLDGTSANDPQKFDGMALPVYSGLFPVNWRPRGRIQWAIYGVPWTLELIRVMTDLDGTIADMSGKWKDFSQFQRFAPSPDPSCVNYRSRFVDQCRNVSDSLGLVAEYEWAAAYWFCFHVEFKRKLKSLNPVLCFHIPIPAAIYGGRVGDSYAGSTPQPSQVAAKQQEPFSKGSSRSQYHRTFIGGDAESKFNCFTQRGANMGAKGYVRIYGDDKEIFDACYVGAKAKPWVLNERFFRGMGTILVGVARRQRNVFDWIKGDDGSDASGSGIFRAFTPDKTAGRQPRIVALAAARAAYAPRTGNGLGNGADSENAFNTEYGGARGTWGRRYELRYDAVTSVNSRGNLKKPSLDPYNGPHKRTLEDMRIGCVCGNRETSQRLRRQWNLSQTDWDGVLLPLRFAFSDPSMVNGHAYDSLGDGKNKTTFWSYSENAGSADPQHQLVRNVLSKLTWAPLSSGGGGTETWEKVFLEPNGMDDTDAYKLFKKRLIH